MRTPVPAVVLLLVLPSAALAIGSGATAIATVYVPDPPHVSVSVVATDGGLRCDAGLEDLDAGDSFGAIGEWYLEGVLQPPLSSRIEGCSVSATCSSPVLAPAGPGEEWTCSVKVTDSYGLSGGNEASYSVVPLGFFGGLLDLIGRLTCGWISSC